jgi:uncharacterized Zn finger protein
MQDQPQTLEVSLEQVKEKIAMGELLDQLHRSPAFKRIIEKGYFKEKAQNLVSMTALPQNDQQKQLVQNGMIGISALKQHFHAIYNEAQQAATELEAYEAELEEGDANG